MKMRSEVSQFEKELKWEYPTLGIRRQIIGHDGQLMVVRVESERGAVSMLHEHYHTQTIYVANGKFELTIGDQKEVLPIGDDYYATPGEPHGCVYLEAGVLIDTSNSMRADFLEQFLMDGKLPDNGGISLPHTWYFLSTKTAPSL